LAYALKVATPIPMFRLFVYSGRFVMCIGCFEERLGRQLTPRDFQGPAYDLFGTPPSQRFVDRSHGVKA
jgi:hypothetical protein